MKYIITGLHSSGKQEIITELVRLNIKCGKLFSNIDNPSNKLYNSENFELYSDKDISDIFENNAYIFIKDAQRINNIKPCFIGLSKFNYDNNDVFVLSPDELNAIPNTFSDNICIIWVDCTLSNRKSRYLTEKRTYNFINREEFEKTQINNYVKQMYELNTDPTILYFANEEPLRVAAIIYTLIKYPELLDLYKKNFN